MFRVSIQRTLVWCKDIKLSSQNSSTVCSKKDDDEDDEDDDDDDDGPLEKPRRFVVKMPRANATTLLFAARWSRTTT